MRPRRIRRGEHCRSPRPRRLHGGFNAATPNSAWRRADWKRVSGPPATLQCGHAEFGVENDESPDALERVYELQCGHAEFGVENGQADAARQAGRGASMRPRRIRRGEHMADRVDLPGDEAS